ncbi:hypothetical protein PIB30_073934 [Stylosanthes scabra]|uniref:Uncharacterized protein n=1 Tax=Stylosanthes scabra TaxID=79078 RepID=A0ABU6SQR6_9FABA|nr:hypothetical protein [Stylosanthes scabra]
MEEVFPFLANMATIEPLPEDADFDIDMFEAERPIYPKAREDLLDLLMRQRDEKGNVSMCPRCSALFDASAARAYDSYKKSKERVYQEELRQARLLQNPTQKGYTSKTRLPPSNVSHNKWLQNNAPNYSRHSHVAWKPRDQADQGAQPKGNFSPMGASSKKRCNF